MNPAENSAALISTNSRNPQASERRPANWSPRFEHGQAIELTNVLERLHREIKRRTAVAALFPNEESLLRLVTAMVAEVSDEWEIGRAYLVMESE